MMQWFILNADIVDGVYRFLAKKMKTRSSNAEMKIYCVRIVMNYWYVEVAKYDSGVCFSIWLTKKMCRGMIYKPRIHYHCIREGMIRSQHLVNELKKPGTIFMRYSQKRTRYWRKNNPSFILPPTLIYLNFIVLIISHSTSFLSQGKHLNH